MVNVGDLVMDQYGLGMVVKEKYERNFDIYWMHYDELHSGSGMEFNMPEYLVESWKLRYDEYCFNHALVAQLDGATAF